MKSATLPALTSMGKRLDMNPECFGEMRRSSDIVHDNEELRIRMKDDGYLLLPGLLNRDEVLAVRMEMVSRLERENHLDPSVPIMDAVVKPRTHMGFRPDLARDNQPLHQVLYAGPMMEFFTRFLGGPVRHYDFTWIRCVAPGHGTPPHYDIVYMGRGTKRLYTAWTPLGDVDYEQGGLMVLEGSNKHERLKQIYGTKDVDSYCVNKPDPAREAHGGNGWLSNDPAGLRRGMKGRWLTTEYTAGDVVIFEMYLVHGSLDNHSKSFRFSTDSRYQLASEPVDERWVGENPPGHSLAGKRGKIC